MLRVWRLKVREEQKRSFSEQNFLLPASARGEKRLHLRSKGQTRHRAVTSPLLDSSPFSSLASLVCSKDISFALHSSLFLSSPPTRVLGQMADQFISLQKDKKEKGKKCNVVWPRSWCSYSDILFMLSSVSFSWKSDVKTTDVSYTSPSLFTSFPTPSKCLEAKLRVLRWFLWLHHTFRDTGKIVREFSLLSEGIFSFQDEVCSLKCQRTCILPLSCQPYLHG